MYNEKIYGTLIRAILGDALGTPFDGMSRGHIKSIFGEIHGFEDPEPALHKKIHLWKKPALYSSLSQFMLLMLLQTLSSQKKKNENNEIFRDLPAVEGTTDGIFRHPGTGERHFLKCLKEGGRLNAIPLPANTCARPLAILSPLSLLVPGVEFSIIDLISKVLGFSKNPHTITGFLVLSRFLMNALQNSGISQNRNIIGTMQTLSADILQELDINSAGIFELSVNPDSVIDAASDFEKIFGNLSSATDLDTAENIICEMTSDRLKTPIKRATVNHPLSILPFSSALIHLSADDRTGVLFKAASMGGVSALLCSITGMMCGIQDGSEHMPETLLNNLVNRKRILALITSIAGKLVKREMISDFIQAEASLTSKERDEYGARTRRRMPVKRGTPSRKDIENKLSRHIVESWTKIDRAKWKKEKKKHKKKDDYDQ